ncbi:MAG: hypothetical protein SF187_15800 [Deltaproteobacteria bacterium]|nr:hypothetical protein [Deltaproteobacteria bacterium]
MTTRVRFLFAACGLALAFAGCSTALSSFNPAHVPRKHGVHAEMGMDVSVPTGTISKTIDAGENLADKAQNNQTLTREDQLQLFDAGVNLALNPPSVLQHFGIAFAPIARTEVSLRFVGGGWRVGGRYQLLEQGVNSSWDLTVGLGGMRQAYSFPIDNVLDIVELKDFNRFTVDVPIAFGRRGSWYRFWGGPRLLWTTGHTEMTLNLPRVSQALLATADSSGIYYGVQSGFAVGYKHVFFGFELNLVQFQGSGTLTAMTFTDGQVGETTRTVDLSGFVVYPGIALMGEF